MRQARAITMAPPADQGEFASIGMHKLAARVSGLGAAMEEAQRQRDAALDKVQRLQADKEAYEQELLRLRSMQRSTAARYEDQVLSLQAQLSAAASVQAEAARQLDARKAELQQVISTRDESSAGLRQHVSSLQAQLFTATQGSESCRQVQAQQAALMEALEEELQALGKQVLAARASLGTQQECFRDLSERVSRDLGRQEELVTHVQEQEQALAEARHALLVRERTSHELRAEVHQLQARLQDCTAQRAAAERQASQAQSLLTEALQDKGRLADLLVSSETALASARAALHQHSLTLTALLAQQQQQQQALAAAQAAAAAPAPPASPPGQAMSHGTRVADAPAGPPDPPSTLPPPALPTAQSSAAPPAQASSAGHALGRASGHTQTTPGAPLGGGGGGGGGGDYDMSDPVPEVLPTRQPRASGITHSAAPAAAAAAVAASAAGWEAPGLQPQDRVLLAATNPAPAPDMAASDVAPVPGDVEMGDASAPATSPPNNHRLSGAGPHITPRLSHASHGAMMDVSSGGPRDAGGQSGSYYAVTEHGSQQAAPAAATAAAAATVAAVAAAAACSRPHLGAAPRAASPGLRMPGSGASPVVAGRGRAPVSGSVHAPPPRASGSTSQGAAWPPAVVVPPAGLQDALTGSLATAAGAAGELGLHTGVAGADRYQARLSGGALAAAGRLSVGAAPPAAYPQLDTVTSGLVPAEAAAAAAAAAQPSTGPAPAPGQSAAADSALTDPRARAQAAGITTSVQQLVQEGAEQVPQVTSEGRITTDAPQQCVSGSLAPSSSSLGALPQAAGVAGSRWSAGLGSPSSGRQQDVLAGLFAALQGDSSEDEA